MAKGDSGAAQNMINQQGGMANTNLANTRFNLSPMFNQMQNQYSNATGQGTADYGNMMNQYKNYLGQLSGQPMPSIGGNGEMIPGQQGTPAFTLDPKYMSGLDSSMAGYGQMAQTGGFSPQNIADIRARAIAPTRAIFARGMENVNRANTLAGGNMANTAPALAKMAREQSQAASDANVNANASIAQMIQQGKLAGLGGQQAGSLAGANLGLGAENLRNQAMMETMRNMGSLYGTTPGMAQMFGQQLLGAGNQQLNMQELQNQLALGLINSQINKGRIPGDFSQGLGNLGSILGLIGKGAGMFGGGGFGKPGGQPDTSSTEQE